MMKADVTVNPDNLNITLTGGLVSRIATALIPVIKNEVLP